MVWLRNKKNNFNYAHLSGGMSKIFIQEYSLRDHIPIVGGKVIRHRGISSQNSSMCCEIVFIHRQNNEGKIVTTGKNE